MLDHRLRETLDALADHGADDPALLRELLEAVLVVGQGVELDRALQRIVEVAAGLVDAQYGALGVRGPDGGLSEFVHIGITDAQRATMGHLPVGRGVLGLLIDDPRLHRIHDLGAHPTSVGFPPNHPPMHTFLGAPIMVRGEVFGSIYLTEKRSAEDFSEVDETVVAVLAVVIGLSAELDPAAAPQRLQVLGSWLINQAALRAARIIGVRFGEVDARRDQYAVMVALEELGQASQADLGRRLMLDRSDMSALIDGLEDAGHAVRERDEEDRRRNVIRLTGAGIARLRELDTVVGAVQDDLLAPLSDAEREQLVALLQRLVANPR